MVRWYHAIFSAYGFWLPNDPRGSWSTFVGSYELFRYGNATKTDERRSLAHDPHDAASRRQAKQALKYPPVRFDDHHREAIAAGFAQAVDESDITIHACAIGYDHIHVIIARHIKPIERVIGQFKGRANQHLKAAQCHPLAEYASGEGVVPSPWSEGCWSVFINDEAQLGTAIDYVKRHPVKEGLPAQDWNVVRPV